jgi:hypothetical protein
VQEASPQEPEADYRSNMRRVQDEVYLDKLYKEKRAGVQVQ